MNRLYMLGGLGVLAMAVPVSFSMLSGSKGSVDDVDTALAADRADGSNRDRGPQIDAEHARADKDLREGRRTPIKPFVDCVDELQGDRFRAHWGYASDNQTNVRRKLGAENRFDGGTDDRGQPTQFKSGTHNDVFTTTAALSGDGSLTWVLDGNRAIATRDSKRCERSGLGSNKPGAGSAHGSGARDGTSNDKAVVIGGSKNALAHGGTAGGPATASSSSTGSAVGQGADPALASNTDPKSNKPIPSCDECEARGTGETNNCPSAYQHCNSLQGVTAGKYKPGLPKSALCRQILDCIHRSHCAKEFNATDCLCGPNVRSVDCFNGSFEAMGGSCRDLIAAGAESNLVSDLSLRFSDATYAVGAAMMMLENCDYAECKQCL